MVATEIAKRFYLTIGFVALLMLVALAVTSTDGWQKRLQAQLEAPALADLSGRRSSPSCISSSSPRSRSARPTFAAGLFAWLMLWRVHAGEAAHALPRPALLAVGATLAAVVFEAAWYGLVNGVDPVARPAWPTSIPTWRLGRPTRC